ncbi:MAG: M1 family aminopeptidase, partial [Ignavibacteria bacterium]
LTHQWFGDKITCRNWENIWLNEGFATFGEAIYNEAVNGKTGYNEFMKFRMSDAKNAVGSIYVQDVNSINEIFSGNRSYAKGCVVLHMLRGVVGDSTFFRILRNYSLDTSIAYNTAVTEDFQRVAEKVHGSDLNYFFTQWIYGENYPKYNVSWSTESINTNLYRASVNLFQTANTNPAFFTMPVNIKIITQRGDTSFTVFNNLRNQTFDFIITSKPVSFKIDPENLILKTVTGEDVVPVSFALEQNYPNPFNPSTNINYRLGKPSIVKIKVFDILGQEITVLKDEKQREGNYSIRFDAFSLTGKILSSGIYFYKLEARDFDDIDILFIETRKMIFIK